MTDTDAPSPAVPAVTDPPAEAPPAPEENKKRKRLPKAGVNADAKPADKPKGTRRRGPPRPHKKLADTVLLARSEKLQKRIDKARGQLDEAERHLSGYAQEVKYRAEESVKDKPVAEA